MGLEDPTQLFTNSIILDEKAGEVGVASEGVEDSDEGEDDNTSACWNVDPVVEDGGLLNEVNNFGRERERWEVDGEGLEWREGDDDDDDGLVVKWTWWSW